MQHRVLGASDVEVDGHPVLLQVAVDHRVLVLGVDEAEVVPARARPLRHRVRLAARGAAAERVHGGDPVFDIRERALAASARLEVIRVRQRQRELALRDRDGDIRPLRVHHRERLAPVPLPREEPVAKLEVDLLLSDAVGRQPRRHLFARCRVVQAVHVQRVARAVDHRPGAAVARVGVRVILVTGRGHDLDDRQIERLRELFISVVVRGHRHDGARAVRPQHVVRDPHRDVRARQRVLRVRPGEHAGFLFRELGALQVALPRRRVYVRVHRGFLLSRRQRADEGVLRRDDEVRRPEQRVRARRVHLKLVFVARDARDLERELRALASTDPVPLHLFDALRPVQVVEVADEGRSVRSEEVGVELKGVRRS
eukprot:15753-Pelagococcus_subviridis.AAC.1